MFKRKLLNAKKRSLQGWLGMEGDPPARDIVCSYKQKLGNFSGLLLNQFFSLRWVVQGWARL